MNYHSCYTILNMSTKILRSQTIINMSFSDDKIFALNIPPKIPPINITTTHINIQLTQQIYAYCDSVSRKTNHEKSLRFSYSFVLPLHCYW